MCADRVKGALFVVAAGLCGVGPDAMAGRFPADAGVIDVTGPMFGAVPDDGLDDHAAIQRVFDLITPNAQIVFFPAGRYDLSREVYLRKTDFEAQAESLPATGWATVTEGGRTFLRAVDAGSGPDTAGRITFAFDALRAGRILRLDHRVPGDNANSFHFRINGGAWRTNTRPFNGNAGWRDGEVVATGIPLQTGRNVLEIAVREPGFEIDRIAVGYLGNYLNNVILQGEDRATTVLRLVDGATDPGGAPFSGALVRWESGVEQFFRTAVRDLTFDAGTGNPQADGLKFHGNNQSTVANVAFRGLGGSGDVALDLAHTAAIGPILVREVVVDGFAVGIHSAWQNASRTFHRITLRNQRTYGWVNEAASTIWVDGLVSENAVTALRNDSWRLPGDGQGRVALLNARLTGLPGAQALPAITTLGNLYAREVLASGYGDGIVNENQAPFRAYRGNDGIDGGMVREWWSGGAYAGEGGGFTRVFPAPDTMLGLPIADPPPVAWDPLAQWDGPHRHPIETAPGVVSGLPDDAIDDTPSLQAAIDSGASTIYLPNGRWIVDGVVELRGSVRRLLGSEAEMTASTFGNPGRIVIGSVGPSPLRIERLANFGFAGASPRFEHASARTVVFESVTGLEYRPTVAAPGDVFISDTVGGAIRFQGGQRVWARQLNIEEDTTRPGATLDARLVNDGATVWVLGFKTENPGVIARTLNGGRTELIGNLHLNGFGSGTPQYATVDAALSVAINIKPYPEAGTSYGTVVETRAGESRTARIDGTGYVGFDAATLWALRGEVIVDDDDPGAGYVGAWSTSSGFPRGFIGSGFRFAAGTAANLARFTPNLPLPGRYAVHARWIGDWGGQDHSGHAADAPLAVVHRDGRSSVRVDQRATSDGWFPLGVFVFEAGTAGAVEAGGLAAAGRVNLDAVRFVRIGDAGDALFGDGFEPAP